MFSQFSHPKNFDQKEHDPDLHNVGLDQSLSPWSSKRPKLNERLFVPGPDKREVQNRSPSFDPELETTSFNRNALSSVYFLGEKAYFVFVPKTIALSTLFSYGKP